MEFSATRIFTDDVDHLVAFYERITGLVADRVHPLFAELRTPSGVLAIASTKTVPLLGAGVAESGANRSVILDFRVDDVDGVFDVLRRHIAEFVLPPTSMPWGNRSLLLRDPDGNLINFFTPVTAAAQDRSAHGQGSTSPDTVR